MKDKEREEFDEWFRLFLDCDYAPEELMYQAWLAGGNYLKFTIQKLQEENYELRQELASWS